MQLRMSPLLLSLLLLSWSPFFFLFFFSLLLFSLMFPLSVLSCLLVCLFPFLLLRFARSKKPGVSLRGKSCRRHRELRSTSPLLRVLIEIASVRGLVRISKKDGRLCARSRWEAQAQCPIALNFDYFNPNRVSPPRIAIPACGELNLALDRIAGPPFIIKPNITILGTLMLD